MKKIYITIFLICISLLCYVFTLKHHIKKELIIINYKNEIDENFEYKVDVSYKDKSKSLECSIDNEEFKPISECSYLLKKGEYKLYLKNKFFKEEKEFVVQEKYEGNFFVNIENLEIYYLALNGQKKLEYTFDYDEKFDKIIRYEIENPDVISIEDNVIYGKGLGTTNLKVYLIDGNSKTLTIMVTDLIVPPTMNSNKSYLPCGRYSKEENELLDKILVSRVKEAGEGTRAGVAAAARFLTLEFPYNIKYFNENGRLANRYRHIDAEGRYYHLGLYLNEYKFSELEANASTKSGPNIWGCKIYDRCLSSYRPNGLTCSGFVSWAMLNGGFDVGDVGAGDYKNVYNELSDLGEHKKITYDYMKNGNYKVGDFIGRDGHAAIIIGITDDTIYTAESLPPLLKVYTYGRYTSIIKDPNLTYVIEMKDVYPNGDGNIKDMW